MISSLFLPRFTKVYQVSTIIKIKILAEVPLELFIKRIFKKIDFLEFVTSGVLKVSLKKCTPIRPNRLASHS